MLLNLEELQQPPFYHEMILVKGGTFMMGSEEEAPIHEVELSSFFMAKYPVTQVFWQMVMGNNPSHFNTENRPVENVSWDDAQVFIQQLNALTGRKYRLPSEAEWEYAARGGQKSKGFPFAGSTELDEVGWHHENSLRETHPVGLKEPNELGLYDMSGNVWEWCQDHWHHNYENAPNNGTAWEGPGLGADRVWRGGSWCAQAPDCLVAARCCDFEDIRGNFLGFRLAMSYI